MAFLIRQDLQRSSLVRQLEAKHGVRGSYTLQHYLIASLTASGAIAAAAVLAVGH